MRKQEGYSRVGAAPASSKDYLSDIFTQHQGSLEPANLSTWQAKHWQRKNNYFLDFCDFSRFLATV